MKSTIISTTADSISSGGTIGGDLTISGDLTVSGSGTYTYDEQIDGQVWIKDSTASSATQGGHLRLFSDDGAALGNAHRLGVIEFGAAEDGSNNITIGARIEAVNSRGSDWDTTNNHTDLAFYTTTGDASLTEKMRVTDDGHLVPSTDGAQDLGTTSSSDWRYIYAREIDLANSTLMLTGLTQPTIGDHATVGNGILFKHRNSNSLLLGVSGSADVDAQFFGNVGIGTAAPAALLHISKDGAETGVTLDTNADSNSNSSWIYFRKAGGTAASPTNVADDERLMVLGGLGYHTNGFDLAANIKIEVDGTPGDGDMPGRIVLETSADGSASPTERMRIDSSGKVGIGTSSPIEQLHLQDDSNGAALLLQRNDSSTSGLMGEIQFGNRTHDDELCSIKAYMDGSTTNGALRFYTEATGAGLVEAMRITSDGTQNQQANYIVNEQGRQDHVANTMPAPYYRFDGVDDYIDLDSHVASVATMGQGSISAWVKFNEGTNPVIMGVSDKSDASSECVFKFQDATGKLAFLIREGGSVLHVLTVSTFDDGLWHHVVVTVGASGNLLYVDGVVQAVTYDAGSSSTQAFFSSVNNIDGFRIGNNEDYGGNQWEFDGQISGVQLYNHALTAPEVKELYSGASVPFKYKGASQTAIDEDDMADDDTGDWTLSDATLAFDTDHYEVTYVAVTQYVYQASAMTAGKSYRISCDIKDGTSASQTMNLTAGTGMNGESSSSSLTTTASWVTHTYEFVAGAGYNTISIKSLMTGAGNIEIKNYSVVPIGAVAEYDGSGVGASRWDDKSGNELHGTVSGATVENAPADADSGLTYEEGTWTGVVSDGSNNATMSNSTGYYTKVGRIVHVSGVFTVNGLGSVSGSTRLTGLPFTCVNNNGAYAGGVAYASSLAIAQYSSVSCLTTINATYATLWLWDATTGVTALQGSEISADGEIAISFSYSAA
jgi:hypothetical protein